MNIDNKILSKILANRIDQKIKRITRFGHINSFLEIQGCFIQAHTYTHTPKPKLLKEKTHGHIKRCKTKLLMKLSTYCKTCSNVRVSFLCVSVPHAPHLCPMSMPVSV